MPLDDPHPDYCLIHMSMLPNDVEYLDPLVKRAVPGQTIKSALPRRLNPNYVKTLSRLQRFKKWITHASWRKKQTNQ